jgi:uncharacterized membrane protein
MSFIIIMIAIELQAWKEEVLSGTSLTSFSKFRCETLEIDHRPREYSYADRTKL